jgi:hypothetical protein
MNTSAVGKAVGALLVLLSLGCGGEPGTGQPEHELGQTRPANRRSNAAADVNDRERASGAPGTREARLCGS